MKAIILFTTVSMLSGCAELMQAVNKDPMRIQNVGKLDEKDISVLSIVSFDASRRNLMVVIEGPNSGRFCAEPPADIALSADSKTKLIGTAEAGASEAKTKGSIDAASEYKDTVTILAQRTVLLDIYRTGTYSLCQYYLNGAIDKNEASRQFFIFTEKVLDAYSRSIVTPTK